MEKRYALIIGEDVYTIFICSNLEVANIVAKATDSNGFAVECTYYSVNTVAKYIDGVFYNVLNNELVAAPYITMELTLIKNLQTQLETTQNALVAEYKNNSELELKINNLNEIVLNIYKNMEVNE